jgi:HAD superfamily hydrolase (TIGR01509 family)
MIKAIIFDFDGVIVNSEPLHYRAFLKTAQEYGVQFDYDVYLDKYVGFDDRDGFRAMIAEVDAKVIEAEDFGDKLEGLVHRKHKVFKDIVNEGFETIPGSMEFIASLPADLPLAIASGATRRDIDLILNRLGIRDRFNPIVTASDVAKSKPDPQTYRAAFGGLAHRMAMQLLPNEVVAIEDTPAGIESARGAGLWTVALATTMPPELLTKAHRVAPGFSVMSLPMIRQWFG